MLLKEIRDPELKRLFTELKHASGTIENDAEDALKESSNETELIENWQSKLTDLYNECCLFRSTLERAKGNVHAQKDRLGNPSMAFIVAFTNEGKGSK